MTMEEALKIYNKKGDAVDYMIAGETKGMDGCVEYLKRITGCDEEVARQIIDSRDYMQPSEPPTPAELARNEALARVWQNRPKCPTCSSTNVKKISGTAKLAGAAVFGIFSKTARSQFQCNNCGYKW